MNLAEVLCTTVGRVVWTDRNGTTHWTVGDRLVPGVRATFVLWTACGSADVPADGAWHKRPVDTVTCVSCVNVDEDQTNEPS